ncbi:glutamate:Na+ symporter, ESS family [Acidaminococcus fermentans]|uniref:Glutamate:Na+ symporter, ESS family n=1 Tax=Acidaminococcus fermentans TaxID=905 RepID=A0A1H2VJF3_ACIFE|nr:sodium/glutamate symporter [Acidaminococcus fermentans]MDD6288081.1 sodium/glutamate symporter [Acidaminococcus fermentans]SDW68471.1 glutamate:Na+ symporter, ESS family [Acidaminococcus fermentans]SFO52798.1 glutamate:Na+ symporter, ESS family [Acidaminococcus fermentans]
MFISLTEGILTIRADGICTTALAAVMLLLGVWLKAHSRLLRKYCLPAPVVGGTLAMLLVFLGHETGLFQIEFDTQFQIPFMISFFTAVGLGAKLSAFSKGVNKGGKLLLIYWLITAFISLCQNLIGLLVGHLIGLEPAYALLSSAISMVGGHGAAGAYGSTFLKMGYPASMEVGASAATFGLIAAVMSGGPMGRFLIEKYHLRPEAEEEAPEVPEKPKDTDLTYQQLAKLDILINVSAILICMGLGVWLAQGVGSLLNMTFPSYVCAMFVGVLVRNLNEQFHFYQFSESLVGSFGEIMLNLYLAIVLMSLKLWEMAGILSGVMLIVLAHVAFMLLMCYFVVFRVLGSNYDAAVMCAGLCGHGLGAVPSAMVNMTVLADQYGVSRKAFLIVPVVGSCLADLAYQPHTLLLIKLFVEKMN